MMMMTILCAAKGRAEKKTRKRKIGGRGGCYGVRCTFRRRRRRRKKNAPQMERKVQCVVVCLRKEIV